MDEAKRPSKAKNVERNQRKIEMDEFCRNHWHQINQCRSTGVSGRHLINRRIGVGAICCTDGRPRGEDQVAPDDPTVPSWSVGASTMLFTREHVKCIEAKSLAPDDATGTGVLCRSNDISALAEDPFSTG